MLPKILLIGFLLPIMMQEALGAKKKAPKQAEETAVSETEPDYLYEVTLDNTIETGVINKAYKGKLIFKTDPFSQRVGKYGVFLVLNEEKSGVLAEIVVSKVRKSKKKAYAKVTRQAEGLKLKDFVNKPVIRLQDLKTVMGNMRIFAENPMLTLLFHQKSSVMSSVNLLTQSSVSPVVSGTGASMDLFYPYSEEREFLNWAGVSAGFSQINTTETIVRLPESEATSKALVSGQRMVFGLIFQPVFRDFWIRNFFVRANFSSRITDSITVTPDDQSEVQYEYQAGYNTLETGFSVNPAFNIYGGLSYSLSQGGSFSLNKNGEENYAGSFSFSRISAWAQILQPVLPTLRIDGRVRFDRQFDELVPENSSSEDTSQKVSDWRFSIIAGIAWSP